MSEDRTTWGQVIADLVDYQNTTWGQGFADTVDYVNHGDFDRRNLDCLTSPEPPGAGTGGA